MADFGAWAVVTALSTGDGFAGLVVGFLLGAWFAVSREHLAKVADNVWHAFDPNWTTRR